MCEPAGRVEELAEVRVQEFAVRQRIRLLIESGSAPGLLEHLQPVQDDHERDHTQRGDSSLDQAPLAGGRQIGNLSRHLTQRLEERLLA